MYDYSINIYVPIVGEIATWHHVSGNKSYSSWEVPLPPSWVAVKIFLSDIHIGPSLRESYEGAYVNPFIFSFN
jgi:hypothetical protein